MYLRVVIVSRLVTFITAYPLLIEFFLVMRLAVPALAEDLSSVIVSDLVTFITAYLLLIESLLAKKLDCPALAMYLKVVIVPSLVTFITAYLLIECLLVKGLSFQHWPST